MVNVPNRPPGALILLVKHQLQHVAIVLRPLRVLVKYVRHVDLPRVVGEGGRVRRVVRQVIEIRVDECVAHCRVGSGQPAQIDGTADLAVKSCFGDVIDVCVKRSDGGANAETQLVVGQQQRFAPQAELA